MFELAIRHDANTKTVFPKCIQDVLKYAETGPFPMMLKGIYGNRLQLRTNTKMTVVHSAQELLERYRALEDPDDPNLMLQEYIAGGDDQVYIFNGYFNRQSECLVGFTGHKIRQFPVHVGCASLGENRWNATVARTTTEFMKAVGYQGILDIGYRLDPKDGQYKVLDINPRVGQAFRLFVAENQHDVVRALCLTTRTVAATRRLPRGSTMADRRLRPHLLYHYWKEGTLGPIQWFRSFAGVEEGAWFAWNDLAPFLLMLKRLGSRAYHWLFRRPAVAPAVAHGRVAD